MCGNSSKAFHLETPVSARPEPGVYRRVIAVADCLVAAEIMMPPTASSLILYLHTDMVSHRRPRWLLILQAASGNAEPNSIAPAEYTMSSRVL